MTTTCPIGAKYGDHDQLVIPYTLEANDMRFATAPGYITGEQFFTYLKDSFDTLYAEGAGGPRQDVLDRPALPPDRPPGQDRRAEALPRLCTIATTASGSRAASTLPSIGQKPIRTTGSNGPRQMTRDRFVERFGGIFEHSPWIADRAFDLELGPAHDSATGLHNALARMFRSRLARRTPRRPDTPTPILPASWPPPNA